MPLDDAYSRSVEAHALHSLGGRWQVRVGTNLILHRTFMSEVEALECADRWPGPTPVFVVEK